MSLLLTIIIFVVLISFLVATHEYGHFRYARRHGVKVEEFALFFGPIAYKRQMKDGWLFTVRWLPLGGFVRLKGEHDSDTAKGSFGAATLWAKSKIMAAGVAINLITAVVLFTILAAVGMPQLIPHQYTVKRDTQFIAQRVLVGYIEPGSPADKAGLQSNDELNDIALVGYSPVAVSSADKLPNVTRQFAGKPVIVYYTRAGHEHEAKVTLLNEATVKASQKTSNPKGYLGISPTQFTVQRSTWSAPIVGLGLSAQLIWLTLQGLGHAIAGLGSLVAGFVTHNNVARQNGQLTASSQVGGPIAIVYLLKSSLALGVTVVLFISAYIALVLGLVNILPIPPMDGGRLWPILITRALKHPMSAQREELVNLIGALVVGGLFILICFNDLQHFVLH